MDTVLATIGKLLMQISNCNSEALPGVVAAVAGRVPVLLDGGISRGTDVLKALALGAKAVFIGRPVLWGLTVNGEEGVRHVLQLLKEEFRLSMALAGCPSLQHITPQLILNPPLPSSKL